MTKIVLVGDCIATGHNCLVPEISGDPNCNLDDLEVKRQLKDKIVEWYLKDNKAQSDAVKEAYMAKYAKEKELAWPSHIPDCVNLCRVGDTFQGMQELIKEYIQENGNPDLLLITDYDATHRCVVVHHEGKKYVVRRDWNFRNEPQVKWPDEVYAKFLTKCIEQEQLGQEWQKKKHQRSLGALIKFIKSKGIRSEFMLFHDYNSHLTEYYNEITGSKVHDLTDVQKRYCDANGKEIYALKLQQQKHIAQHIIDTVIAT